jgi:hypothetical protein
MGSLRIKAFSKWVPGKQMKGKESLRKIILLFLTRKMSGHKLPITPTSIRPRPTKSTNNVEKYDSGGSTPTSCQGTPVVPVPLPCQGQEFKLAVLERKGKGWKKGSSSI